MVSKRLADLADENDLYDNLFTSREKKTLSQSEIEFILKKSKETAEEIFSNVLEINPALGLVATKKFILNYGVKVQTVEHVAPLLASFDNRLKKLTLYTASIDKLYHQLLTFEDFTLTYDELLNTVLSHELFHIIEMNEPDIYTYRFLSEEKCLFCKRPVRVEAASEIGAFHFAKIMNDLPYSPILFNLAWTE